MKKAVFLLLAIALSMPAGSTDGRQDYFRELAARIKLAGNKLPPHQTNRLDGSRQNNWRNMKVLVLLLEFSDIPPKLRAERIADTFKNPENPKSLASYYKTVSDGKFTIDFGEGIKPWIKLGHPWTKYRKPKGDYTFLPDMLKDGLDAARKAGVPIEEHDADKNGFPDNTVFVWSGNSWSAGGEIPGGFVTIDQTWTVMFLGEDPDPRIEGIEPFHPMTLWHETAHFLHLWDLYDHTYKTVSPVGAWDIMGDGTWNGYGGFNAFNRWKCGWLELTEIKEDSTCRISDLNGGSGDRGFKIEIPGGSNEWLIIENRRYKGADSLYKGIPGNGLVIYHLDAGRPYNGGFNDSSDRYKHPGLAVVNLKPAKFHLDAFFSADSGRTTANCENAPLMRSYYNPEHPMAIEITEISKSAEEMTFNVRFAKRRIIEVTAQGLLDFGRARKGQVVSRPVRFSFNGDARPLIRLKADVPWIDFQTASFVGVDDPAVVIVDTGRMMSGRQRGQVIYSSDFNTGRIEVAVDVRPGIGDCNDDGKVDLTDWDFLADRYGTVAGENGYDQDLDFDDDGRIGLTDAMLLSRRFGR